MYIPRRSLGQLGTRDYHGPQLDQPGAGEAVGAGRGD
jgi:hypothetical protein